MNGTLTRVFTRDIFHGDPFLTMHHPVPLLTQCPLCQAAYHEKHVRLVGERGSTRLFHCSCQTCGHAMLALILETQGAWSTVGLVTDLEVQDALHSCDKKPVTSDECLSVHGFLEEQSQDLCRWLLQESKH